MDAALITISYRGDLELARDLCQSVDEFVEPGIEHVLIVPRGDLGLFRELTGNRRRIVSTEEVLGGKFHRLPLPKRVELPFFSLRLRDFWLHRGGISRGWIVQQIAKLMSNDASKRQALIFADSDIVFIRPFRIADFVKDGKLRLYRRPGATSELATHRRWHKAAAQLLGLPPVEFFGSDYIGPLVTWRSDVLAALHDRLAFVLGSDWQLKLASLPALSEYILYGVFAEHVLKKESGHYFDETDLTHGIWEKSQCTPESLERFARTIEPRKIAILIQSAIDMPVGQRRKVLSELRSALKRP